MQKPSKLEFLSKEPSSYNFLQQKPSITTHIKAKARSEQYWPRRKQRVEAKFTLEPFPHNEMIDSADPDINLMSCQIQSTKRREPYPKQEKVLVRKTSPPDILDKNYDPKPALEFNHGRPILPPPSVLHKSITVTGYHEYVQKSNPMPPTPMEYPSEDSVCLNTDVFFQHVRQPDFSDFDKMMIQKPVIIYLQKKRDSK